MSTTVSVKSAVQFTFFLVMRMNITIVTSCDSLIAITFTFSSLKPENKLKKHVQNAAETKYEFFKLVKIFFKFFTRFDYVILSPMLRYCWKPFRL